MLNYARSYHQGIVPLPTPLSLYSHLFPLAIIVSRNLQPPLVLLQQSSMNSTEHSRANFITTVANRDARWDVEAEFPAERRSAAHHPANHFGRL
ncbi:hypothetical protein J6590_015287 [Homalodisca vitripennis]|nr:hypothetical protein J6590_015287 [Homalodisca vitripennis]